MRSRFQYITRKQRREDSHSACGRQNGQSPRKGVGLIDTGTFSNDAGPVLVQNVPDDRLKNSTTRNDARVHETEYRAAYLVGI